MEQEYVDEIEEHFSSRKNRFKILNIVCGIGLAGTLIVGGVSMIRYYQESFTLHSVMASNLNIDSTEEITAKELVNIVIPEGFEWSEGYRLCPYDEGHDAPNFVKNILKNSSETPYSDGKNALILKAKSGKDVVLTSLRAEVEYCNLDATDNRLFTPETKVSFQKKGWSKLIVKFEK